MSDDRYERMQEMYTSGSVPWDQADPPPEVLALLPTLKPGYALDLGCGLGRASLFMAQRGWLVDGVDFIPQAIEQARARAAAAGLSDRARFHVSSITHMDFLAGPYDFALDVGCMHGLRGADLAACHAELLRLLKPGATFLLFAHLNTESPAEEADRWLDEPELQALFSQGFRLNKAEYGSTQVGDQAPWRSAWFWFERE